MELVLVQIAYFDTQIKVIHCLSNETQIIFL
jgi:hypothetical protein